MIDTFNYTMVYKERVIDAHNSSCGKEEWFKAMSFIYKQYSDIAGLLAIVHEARTWPLEKIEKEYIQIQANHIEILSKQSSHMRVFGKTMAMVQEIMKHDQNFLEKMNSIIQETV